MSFSGEFEATLQGMKEAREQIRAMRKALEADLALDPAAALAGPPPEELHAAEEATLPALGPAGLRWWHREFSKNWPEGWRRKDRGWTGRRRR